MANGNQQAAVPAIPGAITIKDRPPVVVFWRVVGAIIMREVRTRFSAGNLGYTRALIEPVVWVLGFILIWTVFGRASPIAVPVELFFLCSIFPTLVFSRVWEYTSSAIRANQGLLLFPIVRPLDFFVARFVLETTTQIFVFVLLAVIFQGLYGDIQHIPTDPLSVLLALLAAAGLGAGIGLLTGCLLIELPSIDVFSGILRRLFFVSSGLFFLADMLPSMAQKILWWNPMLHATEYFRSAYFSEADSQFLSIEYMVTCIITLLAIGLVLERRMLLRSP